MKKNKINILHGANPVENRRERNLSSGCKKAFDYLLNWDSTVCEDIFCLNDIEAKKELDIFLEYKEYKKLAFVGREASGKTVFLHWYFQFNPNKSYYINENTLYFYHSDSGNGIIEARNGMQSLIYELKKLCIYLENERNLSLNLQNYKEFYYFIVNTKKDILDNPWLKNAEISVYQKEIQTLETTKELSFLLMKLKFYLLNSMGDINKIVLVFDNIKDRHSYEELGKKVFDCMCNYDSKMYTGYQVKAVYAVRSKIYWSLDTNPGNLFDTIVKKSNIAEPTLIFNALCQKAQEYGSDWMNQQGFQEADLQFAYGTLDELNKRYNHLYQKRILNLSQYKKEDILRCYRKIIFNQTWIQKEVFRYSVNTYVENEGFLFTNITCIRALACGDNQVYMNGEDPSQNFIPNILYNTPEEDYSIQSLLIIKFFVRNCLEELGHCKKKVLEMFHELFDDEFGMFQQALEYLIHKKIIDKFETYDEDENIEVRLKISPKGAELWDMLQADSVLLEICHEDYYYLGPEDKMEPSYKLIDSMQQHVIFYNLLYMIRNFKQQEDLLYAKVSEYGKAGEYKQYFGRKRMAFYLLEGVTKSIVYSCSRENTDLNRFRWETEQMVNEER